MFCSAVTADSSFSPPVSRVVPPIHQRTVIVPSQAGSDGTISSTSTQSSQVEHLIPSISISGGDRGHDIYSTVNSIRGFPGIPPSQSNMSQLSSTNSSLISNSLISNNDNLLNQVAGESLLLQLLCLQVQERRRQTYENIRESECQRNQHEEQLREERRRNSDLMEMQLREERRRHEDQLREERRRHENIRESECQRNQLEDQLREERRRNSDLKEMQLREERRRHEDQLREERRRHEDQLREERRRCDEIIQNHEDSKLVGALRFLFK